MHVLYVSFDEVPSFKGASTHILSGLRDVIQHYRTTLISLGASKLPSSARFTHAPVLIPERNYLRRALEFRSHISNVLSRKRFDVIHFRGPFEGLSIVMSG